MTTHEFPTDKRRRKFFFGLPALVFLSLAALETIEIETAAETLAALNSEPPAAQDTPVTGTPVRCINPSSDEGTVKPRQLDI